jgi:hypothetical protein
LKLVLHGDGVDKKIFKIIWRGKKGVFLEFVKDWTLLWIFSKEICFG